MAKARVRVLSHRVDKQVEGVALQGGHMTLVCIIIILKIRIYEKAVCVLCVSKKLPILVFGLPSP